MTASRHTLHTSSSYAALGAAIRSAIGGRLLNNRPAGPSRPSTTARALPIFSPKAKANQECPAIEFKLSDASEFACLSHHRRFFSRQPVDLVRLLRSRSLLLPLFLGSSLATGC
jgi:hypothetical protein